MNPELEQKVLSQNIHGLDEIEAGHWVYVGCGCSVHANYRTLKQVERITKTQIIIDGVKFHRSNGHEPGNGWHRQSIQIPTPELLMQVKVHDAKVALRMLVEQVTVAAGILTGNASVTAKTLEQVMTAYNQLQAVLATLEGGK